MVLMHRNNQVETSKFINNVDLCNVFNNISFYFPIYIYRAYCVNPNDGKPTFGIIDSHRSVNQTCKCSQTMQDKLALAIDRLDPSNKHNVQLDKVITVFNSDTHMKCKFSGNFQEVQCMNETCLCVNEKTGKPILDPKEIINNDWARNNAKTLYQPLKPEYVRWQSAVVYGALNRLVCCK